MAGFFRAGAGALAALSLCGAAFAQEAQPAGGDSDPSGNAAPAGVADPAGPSAGAVEEIVVTGSRIRRDNFTSALPVTIRTEEQALLGGLTGTAEMLQSSALASGPQIDNTFGGLVVSGGTGANTFGLRSLNANRTLMLVNGRRFTAAGTRGQVGNVDLNAIPFVAVERIEILKDGASSVYGADAVAGVVNIITRKRLDDIVLEAGYQDVMDYGNLSLLYGNTWDRGYFDFAVEAYALGAVKRSERDYSYCSERPLTDGERFDSNFLPSFDGRCFGAVNGYVDVLGVFLVPVSTVPDANSDFFGSGLPWREVAHGPDGERAPEAGLRDDRNWELEDLIGERRGLQIYSDGLLDFRVGEEGGVVSASYELYFSRRDDSVNNGYRQIFPYIHPNNPTNPFGALGGTSNPVVMTYELLDPETRVVNDVTALTLGFDGDRGDFAWDAFVSYSYSRGEWEYDTVLKDRLARALSSGIDGNGELRCATDLAQFQSGAQRDRDVVERILAAGPDPDCVPLDLFGGDALAGEISRDAADYVTEWQHLETDYDLLVAGFNIEGGLFDLPAGQVRGVLGMEWRNRELDDRPSPASVENNQWGFTAAGRTRGEDDVSELYGELELPLVAGRELAEEFTLNTSWRYTDYSSYGSDSTWRALLNYAPHALLRLRGAVGTSFRAPALYELFLANQTGFVASSADPCSAYTHPSRDLDPGSNLYRNCENLEEQGVIPQDYIATRTLLVTSGGNRNLKAETSDSRTLGVVLAPNLAARFPRLGMDMSLTVDYYEIDIENSISQLGPGAILSRCYGSPGFTAQECALVGPRQADGQLASVNSSFVNVAIEGTRGYDLTLRAERDFPAGDLSVDILAARVNSFDYGLTGADSQEYVGRHAYPKWRGEADIRFQWRDFTFNWSIDYVGSSDEEPIFRTRNDPSITNVTRAGRRFFHTSSVRYRNVNGRWSLVAGIRNVFDEDPPVVGWEGFSPSIATNIGFNIPLGAGYDLLGRRLFASFSYSFAGG